MIDQKYCVNDKCWDRYYYRQKYSDYHNYGDIFLSRPKQLWHIKTTVTILIPYLNIPWQIRNTGIDRDKNYPYKSKHWLQIFGQTKSNMTYKTYNNHFYNRQKIFVYRKLHRNIVKHHPSLSVSKVIWNVLFWPSILVTTGS